MDLSPSRHGSHRLTGWDIEVDRRESGILAVRLPYFSLVGANFRAAVRMLGDQAKYEDDPHTVVPATPRQFGKIVLATMDIEPAQMPAIHIFNPVTGHHETVEEAIEATQLAQRGMVQALTNAEALRGYQPQINR